MKITNKHNLPDAFYRAVVNDPYSREGSDFSATSLAQPPRAAALIEAHADTLEVDCSTKVAVTIGKGAHAILECAARPGIDIIEKRFFADFIVDGVTYVVSAQIDIYESDTKVLYDWKTCKAGAFTKKNGSGRKPEWAQQMNVAAEIMRRQPEKFEIDKLVIVGLFKDWYQFKAEEDKDYPQTEVMASEQKMWPREKVVEYIETRIRLHVAARKELPQCTEHWGGGRCKQYCDAASVCEQYQQSKKTGRMTKTEEVG